MDVGFFALQSPTNAQWSVFRIEMEHPKLPEREDQAPVQLWTKIADDDGLNRYFHLGTKMTKTEVDPPRLFVAFRAE